jgi:hypothetical protein
MGKKINGLKEQEELNVPVLNSNNTESIPQESAADTAEDFVMGDRSRTYSWAMAQLKKQNG